MPLEDNPDFEKKVHDYLYMFVCAPFWLRVQIAVYAWAFIIPGISHVLKSVLEKKCPELRKAHLQMKYEEELARG